MISIESLQSRSFTSVKRKIVIEDNSKEENLYNKTILNNPNFIERILIGALSHPKYILKNPIIITIEVEPMGYLFSSDYLNTHSFGKTHAEALVEFEKSLIGLYNSFYDAADEQLTVGGRKLKERLINYIDTK